MQVQKGQTKQNKYNCVHILSAARILPGRLSKISKSMQVAKYKLIVAVQARDQGRLFYFAYWPGLKNSVEIQMNAAFF